jgi:hypothetical protein
MTGTVRMLSPAKTISVLKEGRAYLSQGAGAVIDAHESDLHALDSAGYTPVAMSGATAARPVGPRKGQHFLDTTLGKLIVADGAGTWRDPVTGAAV